MPFKNNRNSRDDNSKRGSASSSKANSFKSDRNERSYGIKKKSFTDDLKKPFKGGFKKDDERSGSNFSSEKRGPKSFSRNFTQEGKSGGEGKFARNSQSGKSTGAKPFSSGDKKFSDKKAPAKRFNDKEFRSRVKDDFSSSDRPKFRSAEKKWTSEEHFVNKRSKKSAASKNDDGLIRLNRFIANAGICSRRKADELIAAGVVTVNGTPVTELGFKVDPAKDSVRYNGETLKREKHVYVLLNKPKDYLTTTDDPQERKTVMSLVEKASRERIYPVGRLDRNTTGLLLMTNDGDLAEKLSHPRNNITKLYQVELNKNLSQGDLNKILFGIELEDGFIKPDAVSYVTGGTKREVGIQIHSGKNRIVRRIFESLGYEVVKLDRVVYSNLTKKDLPRGRWRYLEEKEIIQLKHLIK